MAPDISATFVAPRLGVGVAPSKIGACSTRAHGGNMGIQIINPIAIGKETKKRTVVMNTRKLHAWVHYYPNPGDHDEMHCHNEDQVFTCFEGQCTMSFPDGTKQALDPGMAALITGGSFYRLENTGKGPMILMGHRSGNQDNVKIIDYVTREDISKKVRITDRSGAEVEFPA
jgi:mannose-6-phosphate isomerase-like protein (cupin superfamily)